jgi:Xaa-Pro aminopeptidase
MALDPRQERFLSALQVHRLDAMLVTHLPNIRYLVGFTGSSGVLAVAAAAGGKAKLTFFTDGRYIEQARQEVRGAKVVIKPKPALGRAAEWLTGLAGRKRWRIGFEGDRITVTGREAFAKVLPRQKLVATSQLIEQVRSVKEATEIATIRKAVELACSVFDVIVTDIRAGVPENLIAAEIEYLSRRMGAEGMSFDTIVASGLRSALPHGKASQNPIASPGFVVLDYGVILAGYCSDMTRTVYVGRPDRKAEALYRAVLESQLAGIKAVKPGAFTHEVDSAARKVLEKRGFGKYFTHSTGHGVGIEIHELPNLHKRPRGKSGSKNSAGERLEPGMIVTVEPGAYVPGFGGVRIEDMVLVTETGCEVLTPTSKEMIAL